MSVAIIIIHCVNKILHCIVKSIYVYSKVYLRSDTTTVTSAERYYILVGAGKFIAVCCSRTNQGHLQYDRYTVTQPNNFWDIIN